MYRCCTYGYWMLLDLYSVLGLIQRPWCTSNIGMCSFWVWMSLNRIHVATRYSQLIKVVLLLVEKKSCSSWSHCTSFTSTRLYTSPETNMNTKNDGLVKGDSFKNQANPEYLFWILGVYIPGGPSKGWWWYSTSWWISSYCPLTVISIHQKIWPKWAKMAKRNLSQCFLGWKKSNIETTT